MAIKKTENVRSGPTSSGPAARGNPAEQSLQAMQTTQTTQTTQGTPGKQSPHVANQFSIDRLLNMKGPPKAAESGGRKRAYPSSSDSSDATPHKRARSGSKQHRNIASQGAMEADAGLQARPVLTKLPRVHANLRDMALIQVSSSLQSGTPPGSPATSPRKPGASGAEFQCATASPRGRPNPEPQGNALAARPLRRQDSASDSQMPQDARSEASEFPTAWEACEGVGAGSTGQPAPQGHAANRRVTPAAISRQAQLYRDIEAGARAWKQSLLPEGQGSASSRFEQLRLSSGALDNLKDMCTLLGNIEGAAPYGEPDAVLSDISGLAVAAQVILSSLKKAAGHGVGTPGKTGKSWSGAAVAVTAAAAADADPAQALNSLLLEMIASCPAWIGALKSEREANSQPAAHLITPATLQVADDLGALLEDSL